MSLDTAISTTLAVLTIAIAYLGMHVSVHPAGESLRRQRLYKASFAVLALAAISLIVWKGQRQDFARGAANKAQRDAAAQIKNLQSKIDNVGNGVRNITTAADERAAQLQGQVDGLIGGKDDLLRENRTLTALVKSLEVEVGERDNRIQMLENGIASVRDYAWIATLTVNGSPYLKGDVSVTTPISRVVENTWQEVGDTGRFRPDCSQASLGKDREAVSRFPAFPFSYYALAYCLEKEGDDRWKEYAKQAVVILEKTTAINGHTENHEQGLAYLRQRLTLSEAHR